MAVEHTDRITDLQQKISSRMLEYLSATHPDDLYESMRYAISSGGKKLRSILVLMCSQAVGGDMDSVLDAAVAVELVHNFTLVHDDIMDHDELRRGRQTVYKKWDESMAILAGDALLVQAYYALSGVSTPHLGTALNHFSAAIMEVCEGQALDKHFENVGAISLDAYFEMIGKKTGRLFSLACELGALIGGGAAEQIKNLYQYGQDLGLAFQLQDDLLDVVGDQAVLGKDIGSDLKQGKKTFLLLYAREHGDRKQVTFLNRILENRTVSELELRKVIDIFVSSGTLRAAQHEIDRALERADSQLAVLPETEARDFLKRLLTRIQSRNT